MSTSNRVLLLGNSIFIGGIAASLAAYPDLLVTQVDQYSAGSEAALFSQPAPVVIYDLCAEFPAIIPSLLSQNPEVILIGVHPNDNFARNSSGVLAKLLSMQDLADLIRRSTQFPAANL